MNYKNFIIQYNKMNKDPLIIYTDGSCVNKKGGWAFIAIENADDLIFETEDSGVCEDTTNNRMELYAVIKALEFALKSKCKSVQIHSDSLLTINCGQKLWKRNLNLDMWSVFDELAKQIKIEWIKVKGHSGDHYNDRVDKLCGQMSGSCK
jgi:ribonuclease HI